ncbi:RNB-domain-containing protein [Mollisia scopiformis]|uniref:RNB-domain-containing protein n=1 Tax=Mollisia scopiformis TaxID=149040 RepID=A0A194XRI4_MOLSC|nr:RNB-domain-containing protein [Mollisia scopiformis]KUJ22761.1 RNB-domain-containing protein [Mollisia scopiformis]
MIRSSTSKLRERVLKRYVCWQCLSKFQQWTSNTAVRQASNATRPSRLEDARVRLGQRQFNAGRSARATVEAQSANALPQEPPLYQANIRERLKQWELENAESVNTELPDIVARMSGNNIVNQAIRPQSSEFFIDMDPEESVDEEHNRYSIRANEMDMVDVGLRRNFLLPGDMVEVLSLGGQRRELAIFIQDFTKQAQFYTMSGRWLHKTADIIKFFVPNFVKPEELEAIKPWLPDADLSEDMVDKLQSFDLVQVPRNFGKPLVEKMKAFWAEADQAYQTAATKMDNAHSLVAHSSKFTYATLEQIANKILSDTIPKMEDGKFPYHVLYSLHRSILQDDIGFRPTLKQIMRGESDYEINSLSEVTALRRITEKIRADRTARIGRRRGFLELPSTEHLNKFVKKAREIIDASRKLREFTECGVLGPSKKEIPEGSNIRVGEVVASFTDRDRDFIYFLESWACLKSFSTHSPFNGIGSGILRAIGRYQNVPLNKTTAFTCLMELGIIPPWETQASFELRLPYTSSRVIKPSAYTYGTISDQMGSMRRDWGNLQVYCVDDVSACEIDDGFSVETTDNPDEFWVHVHIADPAAHLEPESPAAEWASSLTMSVYLPDRTVPMLHPDWVKSKVSLGPNKPCLTHSVKLNLAGEILDINMTPGLIRNVAYLTPAVLHEAIFEAPPVRSIRYTIGKHSFEDTPSRPLLQTHELSDEQKRDMKLLHKLSLAKQAVKEKKGSLRFFTTQVDASTSFGGPSWTRPIGWGVRFHGDPSIRLSIPPINDQGIDLTQSGGAMVVSTMMLLAGEAAAEWCHARGIPVIYRISPYNPSKDDPLQYYSDYVLPSMDEAGYPKLEYAMQYLRLVGKTQPSTTPGPHLGVGVNKVMQSTSPLRRFGDLVNHWQIEAALREEARTGTSLVGNTKEDFLPYSKAQIDAMLPRLAERERFIKQGEAKANREWTLKYLVRVWKFGESKIASPLLFYIRSVDPFLRRAGGVLPYLRIGGIMPIPESMRAEELDVGDAFEVEIESIDVYERVLILKYVRKVPIAEVAEIDASLASTLKAISPQSDPVSPSTE